MYPLIDNIEYYDGGASGEWLFGTTRSNKRGSMGEFIYVWRCDLDANHDPRDTNLQAWLMDEDDWRDKYTHVTGLYP